MVITTWASRTRSIASSHGIGGRVTISTSAGRSRIAAAVPSSMLPMISRRKRSRSPGRDIAAIRSLRLRSS